MTKENYLFIDNIPIIVKNESLARQIKVEIWLGLKIEVEENSLVPIVTIANSKIKERLSYIV